MKFSAQFDLSGFDLKLFKRKMLNWTSQFGIFAYLDNNEYPNLLNRYELLVGAGASRQYRTAAALQSVFGSRWLFGHINYDYKNVLVADLGSSGTALLENEDLHFFEPEIVAYIPFGTTRLHLDSELIPVEQVFEAIIHCEDETLQWRPPQLQFHRILSSREYQERVAIVQEHIRKGDCYELNLCVASYARECDINIPALFQILNHQNPAPFAALYQYEHFAALCSSPERFLAKQGRHLLAQPMKGTIRRSADPIEDEALKQQLQSDVKERAENLMIADLMRNDLAISCRTGSIAVPELLRVYSFPTLHTMISSITGTLKDEKSALQALLSAFPMGSMTGAPKRIVMEIIDAIEPARRELYSGCIGYCNPAGDFDFNVVIRSLLYNRQTRTLSYQTGGAITIDSVADKEWDEVQLKAVALERLFNPS